MAKGKVWRPGMPRDFGLDKGGVTRDLVAQLEATGFGYVDLPLDGLTAARIVSRLQTTVRTLATRFAPAPVFGQAVRRDPEGDGPYYMVNLGERAEFDWTGK